VYSYTEELLTIGGVISQFKETLVF